VDLIVYINFLKKIYVYMYLCWNKPNQLIIMFLIIYYIINFFYYSPDIANYFLFNALSTDTWWEYSTLLMEGGLNPGGGQPGGYGPPGGQPGGYGSGPSGSGGYGPGGGQPWGHGPGPGPGSSGPGGHGPIGPGGSGTLGPSSSSGPSDPERGQSGDFDTHTQSHEYVLLRRRHMANELEKLLQEEVQFRSLVGINPRSVSFRTLTIVNFDGTPARTPLGEFLLEYRREFPEAFNKRVSRTLIRSIIDHIRNNDD